MSAIGKSLLQGAKEALEYAQKGRMKTAQTHKVNIPETVNVRAIRQQLDMTRQEFSDHFGFRIRTLEKWEQGSRQPEGPARAYLLVIMRNPQAVEQALAEK